MRNLLVVAAVASCTGLLVACGVDSEGTGPLFVEDAGTLEAGDAGEQTSPDAGEPDADAGPPDSGKAVAVAPPTFSPPAGTYTTAQAVTIETTTPNATIFFTTDGTNPTSASVVYSGAISIAKNTTLRAFAQAPDLKDSPITAASYVINIPPGTTAPVDISRPTGTYSNPVVVGLQTASAPATICYTLDGSTPTCDATTATCTGSAAKYSAGAPIPGDAPVGGGTVTIKALACKVGNTNSTVTSATLGFRAGDPDVSPPPDEVAYDTTVTLFTATAMSGANVVSIHYTTDGTTPTCLTGNVINDQAGNIQIRRNTTVKALACRTHYQPSNVMSFDYTVRVSTPTLTPASVYANDLSSGSVASTLTNNGVVTPSLDVPTPSAAGTNCWSTGATVPACAPNGTSCTTGTTSAPGVTADNTTVNVVACKPSYTPSTPVASGVYRLKVAGVTVTPQPFSGVFSPNGTTAADAANYWDNGGAPSFTLATATTGGDVRIRYTTDGSVPTCSTGSLISGSSGSTGALQPFTTIKAIACKTSYQDSDLRQLVYADPTLTVTLNPIPPPTSSDNDVAVLLTSTPSTASGTTICYNVGQSPVPDPSCDVVTGTCTGASTYDPANPFKVTTTGHQVKAIACKSGVPNKSAIQSAVYTLKVGSATVTTSAAAGGTAIPSGTTLAYGSLFYFHSPTEASRTITQSCAAGTLCLRYTTDGSSPTCTTGNPYNPANGVPHTPATNAPVPYKVIVCEGQGKYLASDLATFTFGTALLAPTFTPNGGSFSNTTSTQISSISVPGASGYFCYTTDNSDPECIGGGVCVGTKTTNNFQTVPITTTPTTVKAVTCRDGFYSSPIATSNAFNLTVADPTVTPSSNTYAAPQSIAIQNGATDQVKMCWTTDGSDVPSTCLPDGTTTSGAVTCQTPNETTTNGFSFSPAALANLATNVTVKVRACKAGFVPSNLVTRTFTFSPYARTITINGNDDWEAAENALPTENNVARFYLSWDATWVYVGYRGAMLQNRPDRWFHVYFKGSAGPYTATRDDVLGGNVFGDGDPNTDPDFASLAGVNFHLFARTDRALDGVSKWSGSAWQDAGVAYQCAGGGQLATTDALVECRISRADLGLGAASSVLSVFGSVYQQAPGEEADRFPFLGGTRRYYQGNMSTNIPRDASLFKP